MRKSLLTSATAAALAAGVLAIAHPAAADDGIRHVDNTAETCTDTGAGAASAPFCTVGAAVAGTTAGQTVEIRGDLYDERVTVTASGTPEQPITIRFVGDAALEGPNAGFVVDGGHDIRFENLQAWMFSDDPVRFTDPVLDLRDASGITVDGGVLEMMAAETPGAPVVRLSGVTDSLLTDFSIVGMRLLAGITMDAGTSGVTIDSAQVRQARAEDVPADTPGIRVEGTGNTVVNTLVSQFRGAGVLAGPSATGTVLANNAVTYGGSHGIHNSGANGTAITNNTIVSVCGDGIRVDGKASGVSVQNNRLENGFSSALAYCDPAQAGKEVEISIGQDAKDTLVDYNNAFDGTTTSTRLYSWAGTAMSLADFRTASGQSGHDHEVKPGSSLDRDSANSAAPGFQLTDVHGKTRADDLEQPNTGAGPITYADRGATETRFSPTVRTSFDPNPGKSAITLDAPFTVDASASTSRTAPIASYVFRFGDGTVTTQASPVASHRYAEPGRYSISIDVIDSDGMTGRLFQDVSVVRTIATTGVLSAYHGTYMVAPWGDMRANQKELIPAAQFDLVDVGRGHVALYSRYKQAYVSVDRSFHDVLVANKTMVDDTARFTLVRFAEGFVKLKSVATGNYVNTVNDPMAHLAADKSPDEFLERFYLASVTGAPFAAVKATKAPSISGTLRVGSTVKANPGTWTPTATSYAYQWYANGVAIKGATGQSLKIPAALAGKRLTVKVTAKLVAHPSGTATSPASAKIAKAAAPKATKRPAISGTPKVGRTVKVSVGTWSPKATSYKYQWRLNGKVIKGATGKSLKLKSSWRGKKITVTVIARKAGHLDGKSTSKAVVVRR
ncbi:PKD domain-containing protein [Melissospora conviva]|uniref:PKD domain-containing protein n=1 Tax=Melissospora conviva TaxID=3388432 RepID=UPI003C192A03